MRPKGPGLHTMSWIKAQTIQGLQKEGEAPRRNRLKNGAVIEWIHPIPSRQKEVILLGWLSTEEARILAGERSTPQPSRDLQCDGTDPIPEMFTDYNMTVSDRLPWGHARKTPSSGKRAGSERANFTALFTCNKGSTSA